MCTDESHQAGGDFMAATAKIVHYSHVAGGPAQVQVFAEAEF